MARLAGGRVVESICAIVGRDVKRKVLGQALDSEWRRKPLHTTSNPQTWNAARSVRVVARVHAFFSLSASSGVSG